MEMRQFEYFVAVVEEASFTRAADRVHVAQPGVSAQVRRLERELGQPLLDRSGRTVRLTEAGAVVLPYARAALDAAAGAKLAVDELTGLLRGHLTIGTVGAISAEVDLSGLLAAFHADHPAVEITLTVAHSTDLVRRLHSGEYDAALIGIGPDAPPGVNTLVVTDEPLVAVVADDQPLAGRDSITLAALAKHPLIALHRGTGLRASLDAACDVAGLRPRVACEAAEPRVVVQLARHGLGVGVVPRSVLSPAEHRLTITRPELRGRIALAWRAAGPTSPAARALLRRAQATLGQRMIPQAAR
jgi:DNA-binding transcriptional LysR family regulator